ncbi:helix-turn-helix domain-containing protein [Herbiconiux sp. A18JL235]|uniref:Helix-turn-helix domain-containing protein n=1 Tax=Herbiconiux sp. A18JL235 TaxID=3152363 RepID=A0AB39BN55_9MICO
MVIDTLTVWFRRKAPDLIRVVAAATPDTVLFGDTTSAPDVIITDQPPSLASLSPAVLSGHEGTRRVVVTGEPPPVEEDSADPVAYVTIADPPETLVEAVTALTEGRSFVSAGARDLHRVGPAVKLTVKQQRVLGLYVDGLSVVDVAEQVGVTPHAVASHLKQIRKKYRTAGIPVSTKIELGAAFAGATPASAHGSVLDALPMEYRQASPHEPAGVLRWPSVAGLAGVERNTDWDQFSTVMSTLQIAATLGIRQMDVLNRFADGTIPAYRFGKYWIVFTAEFRAWITACTTTDSAQMPPVDVLAAYDETMTYKDLMELFERSKLTIYRWIADGTLPAFKIGNRWLIRTHYLRQTLNENSNQSPL